MDTYQADDSLEFGLAKARLRNIEFSNVFSDGLVFLTDNNIASYDYIKILIDHPEFSYDYVVLKVMSKPKQYCIRSYF